MYLNVYRILKEVSFQQKSLPYHSLQGSPSFTATLWSTPCYKKSAVQKNPLPLKADIWCPPSIQLLWSLMFSQFMYGKIIVFFFPSRSQFVKRSGSLKLFIKYTCRSWQHSKKHFHSFMSKGHSTSSLTKKVLFQFGKKIKLVRCLEYYFFRVVIFNIYKKVKKILLKNIKSV